MLLISFGNINSSRKTFSQRKITMTIVKQLLIANCILATSLTQAVSMQGFDTSTLVPYVLRAQNALNYADDTVQFDNHGSREIIWTGKGCAKALYPQQKAALKVILKELKHAALALKNNDKTAWLSARQLYKAFKHNIYRHWKKTVKNNYKQSCKNNDVFAWGWIHNRSFFIAQD
jgi:hypothetical protein